MYIKAKNWFFKWGIYFNTCSWSLIKPKIWKRHIFQLAIEVTLTTPFNSIVVPEKQHWQYVNARAWLCSNKTLFTKTNVELTLGNSSLILPLAISLIIQALEYILKSGIVCTPTWFFFLKTILAIWVLSSYKFCCKHIYT